MISEKVRKAETRLKTPKNIKYVKMITYFLLGFGFSAGRVLGSLHPFCVSIVAVTKKRYLPFSLAGAIAGCLVRGADVYSVRYLVSSVIAALCSFAVSALELNTPAYSIAGAFLANFLTGAVINFKLSENSSAWLLTAAESILSAGAAFFFYRALNSDYRRFRFRALPLTDAACIIISLSLLVMNFADFKIFVFTPARIIAAALCLTALRFFGQRRALILAAGLGFALSVSGEETLFITGMLTFSILVASMFLSNSKYAAGLAFLLSTAFFCIAGGSDSALDIFIDCAVGTALFELIPPKFSAKIENYAGAGYDYISDGSLRQSLVLKLRFAGAAMKTISSSVEQVSERIDDITRKENRKMKDKISPQEYAAREIVLEKTNQIRRVASDQFFSISDMLDDLAFEFDKAEIFDAAASANIRRLLGEYEIYPLSVSVVEDKYSRIRVEILLDSFTDKLESPKIKKEVGRICSRYFDYGQITDFSDETMLSFSEKPNYTLETGFAQKSATDGLCGDTVKIFGDGRGHSILIISDGMGKGSRAALDGAMGAGLLSKLINAGFGFDSALKVVNSALLVKSNDESLATLDVANIDLFTGKCELLKSGAPASYIIKGSRVTKCELFSMPAGILRGIEFAKRTAVLSTGDLIVLMSDGIADLGEEKIDEILSKLIDLSCRDGANYVLNTALSLIGDGKLDDMSVIVARLKNNN